ncbi:hypothetical protein FA15DRAFT_245567 [Coprinopsis marcescibilis]|uniref:Uncharacterized protein n=1 Tax=Coprinopsis marcescibilis TaxID=230819 RepID=A0A5C3L2L2_COPMA|nr:hypothetical protein FA15DRAFT_245567 [Coprinopsis marcescibilis]
MASADPILKISNTNERRSVELQQLDLEAQTSRDSKLIQQELRKSAASSTFLESGGRTSRTKSPLTVQESGSKNTQTPSSPRSSQPRSKSRAKSHTNANGSAGPRRSNTIHDDDELPVDVPEEGIYKGKYQMASHLPAFWWSKTGLFILVLIFLVIVGTIVGAVLGSRLSQRRKDEDQEITTRTKAVVSLRETPSTSFSRAADGGFSRILKTATVTFTQTVTETFIDGTPATTDPLISTSNSAPSVEGSQPTPMVER